MYFFVKTPLKIDGKDYRTCICYDLKEYLKKTVEGLATEGKAVITEDVCFFCNGKLVEKKTKAKKIVKKVETVKEAVVEEKTEVKEDEILDETRGF